NQFHMGMAAELCAREKGIDRAAQDEHAVESYRRALRAQAEGKFRAEIAAVEVAQRKGPPKRIDSDEEPGRGDVDKLGALKPAFQKDKGTVTAGNSSSINDGAAALVLMSQGEAKRRGIEPLARIVSFGQHA